MNSNRPDIPGLDVNAFLNFSADLSKTAETFNIVKAIKEAPNRKEINQHMYQKIQQVPEFLDLYSQNYRPRTPTNDELLQNDPGSLGCELAQHLQENNIRLDFQGLDSDVYYRDADSIGGYFAVRAFTNHDVLHLLLDRGVSEMDELAVGAFQLGQFVSPYHLSLISSYFLHYSFVNPEQSIEMVDTLVKYYESGKKSRFVFAFKFEDHWNTQLVEIRKQLEILV